MQRKVRGRKVVVGLRLHRDVLAEHFFAHFGLQVALEEEDVVDGREHLHRAPELPRPDRGLGLAAAVEAVQQPDVEVRAIVCAVLSGLVAIGRVLEALLRPRGDSQGRCPSKSVLTHEIGREARPGVADGRHDDVAERVPLGREGQEVVGPRVLPPLLDGADVEAEAVHLPRHKFRVQVAKARVVGEPPLLAVAVRTVKCLLG
mmetsp:Transcript_30599/g.94621  ORF Transcript_30599/g.94621 Transcript_30599/m.94621 type:complete len:203 (-) Transcript_30599:491-1099(-)